MQVDQTNGPMTEGHITHVAKSGVLTNQIELRIELSYVYILDDQQRLVTSRIYIKMSTDVFTEGIRLEYIIGDL